MSQAQLRIYYGPEDEYGPATLPLANGPSTVTVSLAEILPALADALQARRAWLRDFQDEPVTLSTDLYELVLAHQQYNRPSA